MRRTIHPAARTAALFLAALPLAASAGLTGCAPVAVVGTAVLVNDEFVDNSQSITVHHETDYVWASAKASMSHMTPDLLDVDENLRTIRTYVDGAQVTVQVETFDVGETRIRVAARRYVTYSAEVATMVRDRLVRDLS